MSTFQHDFRCRQLVRSKRTQAAPGRTAACIVRYIRIMAPARRPAIAPHLHQAPHHLPHRSTPREALGVVQALGPIRLDRHPVPRERAAGRRPLPSSPSWCRASRMSREAPLAGLTRAPRGTLTRAVVRLENDSWYATAVAHGVPIRSRPFADCLGLFPTGARRRPGRARSGPSGSANPSRAADIHR